MYLDGCLIPFPQIVYLTLNNPLKHNAITREAVKEIDSRMRYLNKDKKVKFVVFYPGANVSEPPAITDPLQREVIGKGSQLYASGSFSAGADIGMMAKLGRNEERAYEFARMGQQIMDRIDNSPKTTVAAISGNCMGGGLELAMACDFRVCTEQTTFAMPEKKIGICPGWGGHKRLQYHIGSKRAEELLNSGRQFNASEAAELGLVDHIVPGDVAVQTAGLIIGGDLICSRSKKNPDKSRHLPINDEEEARLFAGHFQNGAPPLMKEFLDRKRKNAS